MIYPLMTLFSLPAQCSRADQEDLPHLTAWCQSTYACATDFVVSCSGFESLSALHMNCDVRSWPSHEKNRTKTTYRAFVLIYSTCAIENHKTKPD